MNSPANNTSREYSIIPYTTLSNSNALIWAFIISIFLHAGLAYMIPNLSFEKIKKSDLLEVELIKKEPSPTPKPEPVVLPPEPIKPQVTPEPKPTSQISPPPIPQVKKEDPSPIAQPPAPTQTEVIAVAPKPETPPSPIPPAPAAVPPPPPTGPSEAELNDARNRYGSALWSALEKHKQYPRIAQMRGWQGEVVLELLLDGNGKLKSKKILSSSGFEALDKQALDMVEKAAPFPTPPEALRGNQFSIKVPVPFKLES